MKTSAHAPLRDTKQFESPEALRSRLAMFAIATRDEALRRGKIEEPVSCGRPLDGHGLESGARCPRPRLTTAVLLQVGALVRSEQYCGIR